MDAEPNVIVLKDSVMFWSICALHVVCTCPSRMLCAWLEFCLPCVWYTCACLLTVGMLMEMMELCVGVQACAHILVKIMTFLILYSILDREFFGDQPLYEFCRPLRFVGTNFYAVLCYPVRRDGLSCHLARWVESAHIPEDN